MTLFSDIKNWFASGEPWVWLNASAVAASMLMVFGLLGLIAWHGLGHFWPADVMQAELLDGDRKSLIIGEVRDSETVLAQQIRDAGIALPEEVHQVKRLLIKQGNRDIYGLDFRRVLQRDLRNVQYPEELLTIERREWGNLYGRLVAVQENGRLIATDTPYKEMQSRLQQVLRWHSQAAEIADKEIAALNYKLQQLHLQEKKLQLQVEQKAISAEGLLQQQQEIDSRRQVLHKKSAQLQQEVERFYSKMSADSIVIRIASGKTVELPLAKVIQVIQPNAMNVLQKLTHYFQQIGVFVSEDPREANTEGGIFPAIFGTVLMVLLMSIMVAPLGMITAIYLHEYAAQGIMVRLIRIAVNNLAGVPSIVYGVFGLGFFVYFIGGSIDSLFYPEVSPAPVFGTPGLLWASLTLALLTLPVVIVTTEEGLSRIPSAIREGSLALGATKAETLWHTVLPMVTPAMITGMILAVARAAGEVAPLMLVGVVKLAPTLALDGNYPFLHLERKFMHLGFHIYDVGFQSPNVEAARPLVYATALLLVLVIIMLNLTAITVRNHLREKYKGLEHE